MEEQEILNSLIEKQKSKPVVDDVKEDTKEIKEIKEIKEDDKKLKIKNAEKEIVNLIVEDFEELKGFKIFGIFKFNVQSLRTREVVRLCGIRNKIQEIQDAELDIEYIHNQEIMSKLVPLYVEYCLIGLLNGRSYLHFIKPFLRSRLEKCSWKAIYGLYEKIYEKSNIGFFFLLSKQMSVQQKEIIK